MTDLVEFIEARLAEDQERAERGQWTAEFLSQGGRKDPGSKRAYAKDIEREGGYSPARVLREVEAKRLILAEWHRVVLENRRAYLVDPKPAVVVLALALPYADHPDYLAEWSPS